MEIEKHHEKDHQRSANDGGLYGGNDINGIHGLSGFLYMLAAESPPQMPKAKKNPSTKIININTECFRIFSTYVSFILKHSGLFTNLTWVGGLNLGLLTGGKTGDVRHQTTGQLQYEVIIADNLFLKFIEDHFRHFLQTIKMIQDICACKDVGGIMNDN